MDSTQGLNVRYNTGNISRRHGDVFSVSLVILTQSFWKAKEGKGEEGEERERASPI